MKTKDPRDYTIAGKPVARIDIPPKVRGEYRYIQDFRVDGMLHGRVIRPPQAGAKLVSIDADAKLEWPLLRGHPRGPHPAAAAPPGKCRRGT